HARALVHRQLRDIEVVEVHVAGIGLDETDDLVEGGRLAGAVRPEQPDDLALGYLEGYLVDDGAAAVALDQIACVDSHWSKGNGLMYGNLHTELICGRPAASAAASCIGCARAHCVCPYLLYTYPFYDRAHAVT